MTLIGSYRIENDYYIEQAGGAGYSRPIGSGSTRITEVTDPGGSGQTVLRAEVQRGDTFPTTDARCQLDSDFVIASEATDWFRFYLRVPTSANGGPGVITSGFLQVVQMFGAPNEHVAPWAWKLHEESSAAGVNSLDFFLNGTYSPNDRPYTRTLTTEKWIEITTKMKFSYSGYVEMWLREKNSLTEFTGTLTEADQLTFWEAGHTGTPAAADTKKLEYETRNHGINDEQSNAIMPQLYRSHEGTWEPFHVFWGPLVIGTTEADLILFTKEEGGGGGEGTAKTLGLLL